MSRVPYPYENDAELLQGLSNRIRLERVEDLASYAGYVLHDSAWWRVLGSAPTGRASSWVLYPGRDLVLDWSPVDVFSLRSHMEAVHGEV